MKLNSGGLRFCAIYIIYAAVVITLAYFTDDPKGRFVLGSLAWAPAGVTFGILHLFPVMYRHAWTNTPYFLFPACLVIVYLIGWAISTANRRLFYPRRYLTTRFVLCLAVIPIIAELVVGALYAVVDGGDPVNGVLRSSNFLLFAYSNWIVPALACATADWMLRSGKWLRLGTIAGVGCVSTLLTDYGLFPRGGWQWPILRPGLAVAIAALACCWLLDQLTKERSSNLGPAVHNTAKLSSNEPEAN